ncbi:MAG: hemolysin III family protein [Planctomycetia bacterium]|nr:hemolysin III family protein [Planctomycetia bacterium]
MQTAQRNFSGFFKPIPLSEEVANYVTHGAGFALSVVGMHELIWATHGRGTVGQIVGVAVYTGSMMVLYLASTLFHAIRDPGLKSAFRAADHAAIYLLIAGTYTPFLLALPNPAWILSLIWSLAGLGILFKVLFGFEHERVSLFMYMAMGWLGLVVTKSLAERVTVGAVAWLIAGGLAYTAGTMFYVRPEVKYSHAVWHVFVVLGTALHYGAIVFYVVPLTF